MLPMRSLVGSSTSGLLVGGLPPFLPNRPLHGSPHHADLCRVGDGAKDESQSPFVMEMEVISHHLAILYPVETSCQVQPTLHGKAVSIRQGGDYQKLGSTEVVLIATHHCFPSGPQRFTSLAHEKYTHPPPETQASHSLLHQLNL